MDFLVENLEKPGDHRKIDNQPGIYMAVVVEVINKEPDGYTWISVAHYGKQNGDLMRDPEMIFIRAPITGDYFPSYFRNDYLGFERESARSEISASGQRLFSGKHRMQEDQAKFANDWMHNIRYQQDLF
jgi:hypothetical protein